jgi:thiol-disulfide isomerase/thioredoxin
MPFGLIYGALFFFGVSFWLGARLALETESPWRITGAFLLLAGTAVATGLLQRKTWARWAGAGFGLVLAAVGFRIAAGIPGLGGPVLLLSSAAAAILLLVPATGDPRRAAPRTEPAPAGAARWVALAAFAGLAVSAWWTSSRISAAPPAQAAGDLPAAAVARQVSWRDFGTALELARQEGKPILATFVTDWCGYCRKMRPSWNEPAVTERLEGLVAVRIDADDANERNGFSGQGLAERYGVQGFPTQILIDADGRVLSRHDGYQTTRQLLGWLDSALAGVGARPPLGLRSAAR